MSLSVQGDEYFMQEAFKEALKAYDANEIPVGAVIVCNNKIIARAHNQTEQLTDVTAHAEMLAITAAANYLGAKYLTDCSLYVTLEPCVMCAGALNWAQLKRIVYATEDPSRGFNRLSENIVHPKAKIEKGPMQQQCKALLDDFFSKLRKK
ncbi:nucleoside deaminase [Aureibacter tunicatorum]|uniref:tRNA-specific adenosine deaminase n=1 Tax=Aureibacter tunicatorum TaxID=866807 RepID=A0AAE3XK74_9BACT|nr:nucleoside deaminase [Aureibacter tunicatorum]MDR6237937.1 tRNA(adenine34) deaminase [Aureibacter tunicatorum]BDD02970.1 tRNA-specific adenosine deaminase [Aureibacter tunicatorum]